MCKRKAETTTIHTHTHTQLLQNMHRLQQDIQEFVAISAFRERNRNRRKGLQRDLLFNMFLFVFELKHLIFKCPTHYSTVNNLRLSKLSFCFKTKYFSLHSRWTAAVTLACSGHREGIVAAYVWFSFPGLCRHQDVMWVYQMNTPKKR